MHELLVRRTEVSHHVNATTGAKGPVVFSSTGDKFRLIPSTPVKILRFGFISETLVDVGAGMVLAMDYRPNVGSDTDRVQIAAITLGTDADVAVGDGRYQNLYQPDNDGETAEDGETRYVAPTMGYQLNPGSEVVFEVTNAADTGGDGYIFVEYLEEPFTGTRIAALTQVTS